MDPRLIQPAIWNRLTRIRERGRYSTAYLFAGPEGSGKEALALAFAKLLNCQAPGDVACGACADCRRLATLQHEQLRLVFPMPLDKAVDSGSEALKAVSDQSLAAILEALEKKARDPFHKIRLPRAFTIPVNTIRDLRRETMLRASDRGRRMILVFDAQALSTGEGASANALLKILEEPPSNTSFILVSDYKDKLLPTIISRCQQIDFAPLKDEVLIRYLQEAGAAADKLPLIVGLAQGNLQRARALTGLSLEESMQALRHSLEMILAGSGPAWRSFIQSLARLAVSDPEQYRFRFALLQLWFRAAYRYRLGLSDPLHTSELETEIRDLTQHFPRANFSGIFEAIEQTLDGLNRNFYTPLVLTNFLIRLHHKLNGE